APAGGPGQAQGQLVRLAPRVHEVADAQRLGQETGQALRVGGDKVVQVARVRVEQADLLLHRPHHARVPVADEGHGVVAAEKGAAGLVVQVLHEAAHDLDRPAIGEPYA